MITLSLCVWGKFWPKGIREEFKESRGGRKEPMIQWCQ